MRLHGVLHTTIWDRNPRFVSRFWNSLLEAWGTKLSFNAAFHPQMDSQSEHTIQMLQDMLKAWALDFDGKWDDHLPLATIRMPPYEALYGRKCRSPLH